MSHSTEPIRIVCAVCGSTNVSRDAWAEWDEDDQQWTLRSVFDYSYCHACDDEQRLEEKALTRS